MTIKSILLAVTLFNALCTVAQTKQETVDWLNSKFNKNPIVYGEVFKASQKMKINPDGSFEIISTDYETPFNPSNPVAASITTLKGNFKTMSPSSVTARKSNGLLFIDIKCAGVSECIKVVGRGSSGVNYDKTGITFGAFYNDEENIASRLKKAFIRLITLCGGKKEAF
jgi:hypothetical protein